MSTVHVYLCLLTHVYSCLHYDSCLVYSCQLVSTHVYTLMSTAPCLLTSPHVCKLMSAHVYVLTSTDSCLLMSTHVYQLMFTNS